MNEEQLYDPIGKWLINEKGCQRDEYSQGYLKNIQIGDVRPDVFAIRYEIITDRTYPVIHFHGYVVEVKGDEKGLNELIGKIIRTKRRVKTSEEWMFGLHTVRFYIAYPTDQVSSEIFEICEEEGIGILRLQVIDESTINVYEVLEPKEVSLNGISHSSQRSPGVFEDSMNSISYLRQMFQRPSRLYNDFIRPKIEEYKGSLRLNQDLSRITNRYAKESLDFLLEKILSKYPQLKLLPGIQVLYDDQTVLKITTTTAYFYVELETSKYRVISKDEIIEFKEHEGKRYKGNLEMLIASVIMPYIKTKLNLKSK
ncbi:MAG: hypothetical protein ACTSVW_06750 [Candidatus Njordarchaeales archaeon]